MLTPYTRQQKMQMLLSIIYLTTVLLAIFVLVHTRRQYEERIALLEDSIKILEQERKQIWANWLDSLLWDVHSLFNNANDPYIYQDSILPQDISIGSTQNSIVSFTNTKIIDWKTYKYMIFIRNNMLQWEIEVENSETLAESSRELDIMWAVITSVDDLSLSFNAQWPVIQKVLDFFWIRMP